MGYRLFDSEISKEIDLGDFAVYPQGTNISNAPLSEDFLKTANLGLYLGYTKGVLDVSYDSFLNPIIYIFRKMMK